MKKILTLGGLLVTALTLQSCGSSTSSSTDSGTTEAATISSLESLPKATSPVEDGSSGAALMKALDGGATTGMPFGTTDESSFSADSSIAACESFNMTRQAIGSATNGDLIQCYVTSTFEVAAEESDIDIYDGEYHVFALNFSGSEMESEDEEEGGGPTKVKFKINKDENGAITQFEMFSCNETEQDMYLNQTIDGNSFTMTSKNVGSDGTWSYADDIDVTGTLNSDGSFVDEIDGDPTPKNIQIRSTNTGDWGDFYGVMSFNQYADWADMTGYMSGSHSFTHGDTTEECTFNNGIYSMMELLDTNEEGEEYNIGLLALGDGMITGSWNGGCGDQVWEDSHEEAWLGDTTGALDPITDSIFYDDVHGASFTEESEPTIAFEDSEAYDCTADDVEYTINFAEISVNPMLACGNLELPHDHIECWQIVEEGNGGGNE